MTSRAVAFGLSMTFLVAVVVFAQADPVTLEKLHKGEKYGRHTRAKIMARRLTAQAEQQSVERVVEARKKYQARLEELREFYKDQGNADALRRVNAEIEDLKNSRKFRYQNWEDVLPDLSAETANEKADELLKKAHKLRGGRNPFNRDQRYRKATKIYREILEKFPRSTAVEHAAFALGEIHSSSAIGEYKRAVRFYELCYLARPQSTYAPLYCAARVLDNDLADYDSACRYYYMTSKIHESTSARKKALKRLRTLQEVGYGSDFVEAAAEAQAEKKENK